MIAWLSKIAGLLGGLITVMMTEEGRRWIARGTMMVAAMGAIVGAFLIMKTLVKEGGEVAFNAAWQSLGSDGWTVNTLLWLQCVTPASMGDAIAAVFTIVVAGAALRFSKYVWQLRMG